MSLVGLRPGSSPVPNPEIVLRCIPECGPVAGTRDDLAGSLGFADQGTVSSYYSRDKPENLSAALDKMRAGQIEGRVVVEISPCSAGNAGGNLVRRQGVAPVRAGCHHA